MLPTSHDHWVHQLTQHPPPPPPTHTHTLTHTCTHTQKTTSITYTRMHTHTHTKKNFIILYIVRCGIGLDVWFEPFTEHFFATNEETNKPTFLIFTEYFNFKFNMKRCYELMKNNAKGWVIFLSYLQVIYISLINVHGGGCL